MAKYKTYPEYKDSGVEWIGLVPKHWKKARIKELVRVKGGHPFSAQLFGFDEGTPLIRIRDIFSETTEMLVSGHIPKTAVVNNNDILIGMDGDFNVSKWKGEKAALNQRVASIEANGVLERFLYYLIPLPLGIIHDLTYFTTVKHLSLEKIEKIAFSIPELQELTNIVEFLDHETAKIDKLIEKQKQLIELLNEKRQAVISQTVTKGLDPSVPMKDSGVEWLGDVPEHWRVVKLSYFLRLQSGDGITSEKIEPEGAYPVYGGNGIRGYTDSFNCDGSYVLIGRQGALCGNVHLASGQFYASEHAVVVYPRVRFSSIYLLEFLRFMNLGQYSVSAAQPGVSVERINMLSILLPPFEEQEKITFHIREFLLKNEKTILKSQKQICLLEERRASLISAAVTGKIDVRDVELTQ